MYAVMSLYLNVHRLTRRKNREIALSRELKLFNLRRYRTNYRTNKVGFFMIFFYSISHFINTCIFKG
ncbi:MAG: hypothetical protein L6V81_04370 [Clostridium sp.]|nr:MAG: hypothetical protein L6V81_04370 [Clostridium sp.]